MKTKMKTMFVFFLAAAFAVSCGKNESGGNSNSWGSGLGSNLGNNNQLDNSSQQVIQRLNQWYTTEPQQNYNSPVAFARAQVSQNYNNNQQCFEIFGFELGCANWGYNSGGSQYSYTSKTCTSYMNNGVMHTKVVGKNDYCYNAQTGWTQYNKNQNAALNELFQTNSNLVPIKAIENGNVVVVWMGYNNGYQVPVKMFVIDKSLHSVFNPVKVMTQSTSTSVIYFNY